jgi:hypothetical protein
MAALILLPGVMMHAQEFRATLSGQVTDPTGATVANATVTAVSVSSGTTYTAKTSKEGTYYIPYVLPDTYTVTCTAQGFKTAVQDKVRLFAAQGFGQNFTLEVGGATERVVVTTAPPELETTEASGGQVIESKELEEVPLNGHQAYMMIGTTPGSQFKQTAFGPGVGNSGTRGWDTTNNYTIGGGATGFNQFTVNGINVTEQIGFDTMGEGTWQVAPSLDTISEVNVITSNYNAQYSRTSGGTINTVTKSGTNKFHGDLYETYNGSIMNANNYQGNITGTPRTGYVENQYDGTVGGPILKNKLFFFFGFEGYNESIAAHVFEIEPPAWARPGYNGNSGINFGLAQTLDPVEYPVPTATGTQTIGGVPVGLPVFMPGTASCLDGGPVTACSGNHIVQTMFPNDTVPGPFNVTGTDVLSYIPLPNLSAAANEYRTNNYFAPSPDLYHYYQPSIRVDYNLNDKTKLYSYYEWQTGMESRINNGLSGMAANGNIGNKRENWAAGQDYTHTFSPTFLVDAKLSFSRIVNDYPDHFAADEENPSKIGLTMPLPGTTTKEIVPTFGVSDSYSGGLDSGNTIFGNQEDKAANADSTLDVDFTKEKGPHSLHFGGTYAEYQFGDPGLIGSANGNFSFNQQFTAFDPQNTTSCYPLAPSGTDPNKCNAHNLPNGSGLVDLLMGYPTGGSIDWNETPFEGQPIFGIYAQDDWRVNHRLTINLGVRWDVQRGLRSRTNELNRGMCFTCVNPISTDPNYQANIADAHNIAQWAAAGIPTPGAQVLGGILYAGVGGQSRDGYNTEWNDVAPRVGFAFALNPKTVIRGGFGIVYNGGLEGGSEIGFTTSTNYLTSVDGGNDPNPTNGFNNGTPYAATPLQSPTGNTLGLLEDLGDYGDAFDFPDRKLPRDKVFSLGFQRELPGRIVLDARYAGNYASKLRTFLWLNGTMTAAQEDAAVADPSIWSEQVPNPYYNVNAMVRGGGGCGAASTVEAIALLIPFSQYCAPYGVGLIGQYNAPLGHNWYNGLEVKLNRHIYGSSRGLFFQIAYTWSKSMNGDGYQNGWPNQDAKQVHWLVGSDRTQILTVSPIWDLPIGKGAQFLPNPPAALGYVISGWTLSANAIFESGTPMGIDNGLLDSCPLSDLRPIHGSSTKEWFNTADGNTCWTGRSSWQNAVLPGNTNIVRNPTMPNVDLSLMKTTPIKDGVNFILRLDAFNATNSVLFEGPDTNPQDSAAHYTAGSGWSGYGTVGSTQQNFPRMLKVGGKITF